jgi:PAS domain S-box-containing protein
LTRLEARKAHIGHMDESISKKHQYSGESIDKIATRPRFGLRLKLLVVISVLILSVSSFFAAYFARIMSTNMISNAEEDVETLSNILATSIELGLWARDKSLLKGPALGVCNHSLVRYVAIYDASGEPLVVCRGAALGTPQSTSERRHLPEEVRGELQQSIRRADFHRLVDGVPVHTVYLRITHPQAEPGTEDELSLFGSDDQMATGEVNPDLVRGEGQNAREYVVSGFAEIEASLGWMRAERARIVRSSVIIALAGFCVAVMLNLVLSRKITSPLAELVRGTEKVGEGDLEYRIGLRTNDEIGLLAQSFDKMADQLNESRRQIEEYSRNLERKVAERTAELEASENRFRSVFESSPIGILTADKDGVVTGVNEAYLRVVGGEGARDRIVGKFNLRDAEVFRRAGIEECFTHLFEGYPFDIEAEVTSIFGKELILRYLGVPLFDSLGHVSRAVVMVEDIAERKRAEQALRIKDSAIESSINAIAIAGLDGSMTYVNRSFLLLAGGRQGRDGGRSAARLRRLGGGTGGGEKGRLNVRRPAVSKHGERRGWQTRVHDEFLHGHHRAEARGGRTAEGQECGGRGKP